MSGRRPGRRNVPWPRSSPTSCTGRPKRAKVEAAAKALFGQGDLADLDGATLDAALAAAPHAVVSHAEWSSGLGVADALARSGLVASKGAARRTIAEGGAYVGNVRIADENAALTDSDLLAGRWVLRPTWAASHRRNPGAAARRGPAGTVTSGIVRRDPLRPKGSIARPIRSSRPGCPI